MPNKDTSIEEYERRQKADRLEEAVKAGVLTREIANMPDGGRSVLGEETWEKLEGYAQERASTGRRSK